MVMEITTPPIVNTGATRALRSKQLLTQDSGSPFHSDQNEYSRVSIAKELPELFEVQDCYLLYLLLHSVVCVGLSGELVLILIFCIQFFILMFLMLISLFSSGTSFILFFILLGALLPRSCINTCVFRLKKK